MTLDAAMPRVTVVMAVYNAAQFLRQAVASVLAQSYLDFELIAVEDSSSDDSLSILESFCDPRLRIIKHRTNMGAALSRNDALAAAQGEFVAIMDADDVCVPTRLERQVTFLDQNPTVGLVGCGVYECIDASGAVLWGSQLPEHDETIQGALLERWCFLHSSIMFRRTLYECAGGYRKEFEPVEDHDFVLRIVEHCQAHNLQELLTHYRLNPKGLSVMGHRYIDELRDAAIRLARRRRKGQLEDLEGEVSRVSELKRAKKPLGGLAGAVQRWRDSVYAAERFYGFGCRELGVEHLDRARRCFARSIRTNGLFVKSWILLVLLQVPFAASCLKLVFRSSLQHDDSRSSGWGSKLSQRQARGRGNQSMSDNMSPARQQCV
jgi:glycosyltransferase involved in cell wall biosynthesis